MILLKVASNYLELNVLILFSILGYLKMNKIVAIFAALFSITAHPVEAVQLSWPNFRKGGR